MNTPVPRRPAHAAGRLDVSNAGPPSDPSIVGGRYELLFELASGGMGTVHVGRRLGAGGFQRLVAIKRMHPSFSQDPESVAAFRDEARIASLVQHANVVAIHDIHQVGDEHLLVMDYIDGASLATLLGALRAAQKRLARKVALRIVIDALRGLHAAHELCDHDGRPLELVHRDATPHNILIGTDGCVRLTDFGIARAAARTVNTEPGFAKGKYTYMAPEHAFAEPLDRRADVFTMGVVAWESLTGLRLFANRTIREVARGAALGEIPAPSEAGASTPSDLDRIVLRALAPWRENRYDSAADFADALYAFATRDGGLASPSAVAEVLQMACGVQIRERRERIQKLCGAQPDLGSATDPPPEPHDARALRASTGERTVDTERRRTPAAGQEPQRIFTPTTASIDVRDRPDRARTRSRTMRRWATISTIVAVTSLLGTVGAMLAGIAGSPAPNPASRFAPRVTVTFSDVRTTALQKIAADRPPPHPDPPPRTKRR